MGESKDATTTADTAARPWFALSPEETLAALRTDAATGLSTQEADRRRAEHGANEISSEPPPSAWAVTLQQLADPMSIMLIVVSIVSIIIGELPVGVMVGLLVVLNVVLGTQQELKARSAVDALSKMSTPQARVLRDGRLVVIDAVELVPGDIVSLEAGEIVPADGRLVRSASLETQEAALTGESAPIPKDPSALDGDDVALGDRSSMVFQNTSVTRGTATIVVTGTGMLTEMGRIATMLSAVAPTKSPLQRELASLTKVLGAIAWIAVAIIVIIGLLRHQPLASVLLLGISMAVSAIPTGMPTFVQAMLAFGARRLAQAKAVVKKLNDVETLGATSAINSDKTGTLTKNEMMVRRLYYRGDWYSVEGDGYSKSGRIRSVAGEPEPDFSYLALGLCLDSDATVSDAGAVIGDPTEAALVVLAAKLGADAEDTRRAYPRLAEVPFDSAYKFMATFHELEIGGGKHLVELVKGGPDVILDRCTGALGRGDEATPISSALPDILAANREMSERGLRVLAFAVRVLDGREAEIVADPMSFVGDLTFIGMVGIIDPLRPEAIEAVATAHAAGISVRMITGDHTITAGAIGAELGIGDGALSGAEIQAMSDEELLAALPHTHVFGRVTPQDKLRLARLMQSTGEIVAMTGDAVNDAAALKQADVGVAMGSGSEVTKQSANMILTDDNFGTLVAAIELGRAIYDKILGYIRFQMTQLLSLVMLFLVASIFSINDGIPLTPLMVLFQNFFICAFPVIMIMLDPVPADLMRRPPRDTTKGIVSLATVGQWLLYGFTLFAVTLGALLTAPGTMSSTEPNVPVTMAFVVMAFGSVFSGIVLRRDPESGLVPPIVSALRISAIPVILTVLAVQVGFLQDVLMTTSLTPVEWLTSLGWALVLVVVIEVSKAIRRARRVTPAAPLGIEAVTPHRALQ